MIAILCAALYLMPPAVTEVQENGRIEWTIPDGYNGYIRVNAPAGMEDEGREQARVLYRMIHAEHSYYFMTGGIEVGIKAHSYSEAVSEAKRWIKLIGGSQ